MEFETAALPVRWLRPAPVRSPSPHADAARWRAMLLEAGLLVEVPPAVDEHDPRAWIAGVQQLLGELALAEEAVSSLQTRFWDRQWKGMRDLPWSMLLLMVVVPWCLGSLVYVFPELFGAHLGTMLLLGVAPFLAYFLVKNIERVRMVVSKEYREHKLRAARQARERVRAELQRGVAATLDRSFVARGGPGLIARAADLEWLQRRAREARRAGEEDLAEEILKEASAVESAMRAALESPPAHWSDAGMGTDRAKWERQAPG